jgi:hypothetical protein
MAARRAKRMWLIISNEFLQPPAMWSWLLL